MTIQTAAGAEPEILLVDDEQASLAALRRILRTAGFTRLHWTTDAREAVQLCLWRAPDLVLLDLHMPFLTGDQIVERMRAELPPDGYLPVIVLTGDGSAEAKRRAFMAGAQDFLAKPIQREEMLLRIRNQLAIRRLHGELQAHNSRLEEEVRRRTAELHQSQLELLDRLARACEYRDDDTGEHARRVGDLSARLASELGLRAEMVELIWRAATLHDVGKIGVADSILLKPGKLTPDEMGIMRSHVSIGAEILGGGSSAYLEVAERIALTHHEWWDGNGYLGMRGEDIPIEGRIVAVADVFDALRHERPYKAAWTLQDTVAHIGRLSAIQFDPAVVQALLRVLADDGFPTPPSIQNISPLTPCRAPSC